MLWSRLALVLEPLQKKEVKREIKRVSQTGKRIQGQHKKYRLAKSQARKRDENMTLKGELKSKFM